MNTGTPSPCLAPDSPAGGQCVQRWVQGHLSVVIYLGDCHDIAPQLHGVDSVISDPPYGMDWDTNSTRFTGGEHKRGDGRNDWGAIANDAEPFDPAPWLPYPQCVLFGANHFGQRLPVGTTLVWLKKDQHLWGTFLSDAEIGWMKGGHGVYAFRKPWNPPAKDIDLGGDGSNPRAVHPTQKPVALMAWAMDRAKVPIGATVLDPFMGSGTTGIACLRTGRNFIGIEKDPVHFATARERLEREISQGVLL